MKIASKTFLSFAVFFCLSNIGEKQFWVLNSFLNNTKIFWGACSCIWSYQLTECFLMFLWNYWKITHWMEVLFWFCTFLCNGFSKNRSNFLKKFVHVFWRNTFSKFFDITERPDNLADNLFVILYFLLLNKFCSWIFECVIKQMLHVFFSLAIFKCLELFLNVWMYLEAEYFLEFLWMIEKPQTGW